MKLRPITLSLLVLCLLPAWAAQGRKAQAKTTETISQLTASRTLDSVIDLHITASSNAIAEGCTLSLSSQEAWVFFDNMKPNDVLANYASAILVDGQPFDPEVNGRICVYKQGAALVAQDDDFTALTLYSETQFAGEEETFRHHYYYTNCPPDSAPDSICRPLTLDNAAQSFRLKRGYMATLACEEDGMGYSRVFIADTADLEVDEMQLELIGKVSYVRVIRWQYPSKKGWVGSTWSSMPDSLKYAPQQADFTNSTWFYNWGLTASYPIGTTYNQEFVPEKWGAGGNLSTMFSLSEASHLLGYNEPDHSEQSNVSVETAVAEWPSLLQTGMRLGSPATTDFTWLYNFMSECKKLNYRVDYVVIHAYWGGLSGSEWYEKIKTVHETTGRPIWIKEWNNGANWTTEGWPSSTEDQYAKQLSDLTAILNVLDTCSFVERYSIYNWVEDKRMIISSSATLTSAGEYYAADQPDYFFNRDKEVTPTWTIYDAPVLSYDSVTDDGNALCLTWTDVNGEQIDHFTLQQSTDEGSTYSDILESEAMTATVEIDDSEADVLFRVQSTPLNTSYKVQTSNSIDLHIASNEALEPYSEQVLVRESWKPVAMRQTISEEGSAPAVLLSAPTYRNKQPLAAAVRDVSPRHFDYRLGAWLYEEDPTFYAPDTIAYLALPTGLYTWGDITAQVDTAENIGTSWRHIAFGSAFESQPIVLATRTSCHADTAAAVCVKNITPEGFDIRLRFEGTIDGDSVLETVSWLAATPGEGLFGDEAIVVGCTADSTIKATLSGGGTIDYGTTFTSLPHIFAQMQTENDTITATLRVYNRGLSSATLIKDREKASSRTLPAPEQVGFLLIGPTEATGIRALTDEDASDAGSSTGGQSRWITLQGITLPGKPAQHGVYIYIEGAESKKIRL